MMGKCCDFCVVFWCLFSTVWVQSLWAFHVDGRKGLVLFIDEADAFLRRGRAGTGAMSEDSRNVSWRFKERTLWTEDD